MLTYFFKKRHSRRQIFYHDREARKYIIIPMAAARIATAQNSANLADNCYVIESKAR
jgi:hypothetical protein